MSTKNKVHKLNLLELKDEFEWCNEGFNETLNVLEGFKIIKPVPISGKVTITKTAVQRLLRNLDKDEFNDIGGIAFNFYRFFLDDVFYDLYRIQRPLAYLAGEEERDTLRYFLTYWLNNWNDVDVTLRPV